LFNSYRVGSRSAPSLFKIKGLYQTFLLKSYSGLIKDTDFLLYGNPGRDGKRRSYQSGRVWDQALERSGVTNLRFPKLRHEAISRFVEAGLSDQQVSSIKGHKSMQMLKRYTHLRKEDFVSIIKNVWGKLVLLLKLKAVSRSVD